MFVVIGCVSASILGGRYFVTHNDNRYDMVLLHSVHVLLSRESYPHKSTLQKAHVPLLTMQYYKALTVRPGSPLDPIRRTDNHSVISANPSGRRKWSSMIPAAICVGPLRGLASTGESRVDQKRSRAIKEITAQQEIARSKALNGIGSGSGGSKVERRKEPIPSGSGADMSGATEEARKLRGGNGRICKKCVEGPDGPPPKPGEYSRLEEIVQTDGKFLFFRANASLLSLQKMLSQI